VTTPWARRDDLVEGQCGRRRDRRRGRSRRGGRGGIGVALTRKDQVEGQGHEGDDEQHHAESGDARRAPAPVVSRSRGRSFGMGLMVPEYR